MELGSHVAGVVNISPDDLRAFMATHKETEYVLIDVRQPEEYSAQHVPGAYLIPLMEVEDRAKEVQTSTEKYKIFMCRSGGRSGRAASFFADLLGTPNVFNVAGGMLGWNGDVLPDFPKLKAMDLKGGIRDVLEQAISFEKGADKLYEALLESMKGTAAEPTLKMLADAEEAHGRAVYGALKKADPSLDESFEQLYDRMSGTIVEGGATVQSLVKAASAAATKGPVALLEFALELELTAYDLYRNLAHRAEFPELRATFLELAEHEKKHAKALLKAIGEQSH